MQLWTIIRFWFKKNYLFKLYWGQREHLNMDWALGAIRELSVFLGVIMLLWLRKYVLEDACSGIQRRSVMLWYLQIIFKLFKNNKHIQKQRWQNVNNCWISVMNMWVFFCIISLLFMYFITKNLKWGRDLFNLVFQTFHYEILSFLYNILIWNNWCFTKYILGHAGTGHALSGYIEKIHNNDKCSVKNKNL